MAEFSTTITVKGLPITRAFAYLSDFSSAQDWDPGVSTAQRNDSGPVKVGSSFDLAASFLGREIPLTYHVTELEPDHRVVLRAENASVISLDTLTFVETADGCSVTYDAVLTGKGAFKLMGPALQLTFDRIGKKAEAGLAARLNKLAAVSSEVDRPGGDPS